MTFPKKDVVTVAVGDGRVIEMYKVRAFMEQIPTGELRDQKAGHWTCCGRAEGE